MMRLVSIEIERFRGWRGSTKLALDCPITAIVADNGCGKSSTLNALEWCLYGDAIIGKSSSGIDERRGWQIRPRAAGGEPTEVRTVFAAGEGRVEVVRREAPAGKKSDRSDFEIRMPDGATLSGAAAEAQLRELGVPDWNTFRIAHCFHQEAARRRILDSNDRSTLLATLLGLDEDVRLRDVLKEQDPAGMIKAVDELLDKIEAHIANVAQRPLREMEEATQRLVSRGLARTEIHAGKADALRGSMLERAAGLAAKLGISIGLPDAGDAAAVRAWADRWAETARRSAPALAPLDSLRASRARLATVIGEAEEVARASEGKKQELERKVRERGDRPAHEAALAKSAEDAAKADAALAAASTRAAVLQKAREALDVAHDKDRCPVCDSDVAGLVGHVAEELARHSDAEIKVLRDTLDAANAAMKAARSALDELRAAMDSATAAAKRRDHALATLRVLLEGEDAEAHDVLAAARKRTEKMSAEIARLDAIVAERDRNLTAHAADVALLRDLEHWLAAAARADRRVDVEAMPEWKVLDRAIDDVAGFASDLDALAELARDLQTERSEARAAEVNRALGRYYALITRDDTRGGVRVDSGIVRGKVEYGLLGDDGEQILPLLNQASLNALSLAVLFAQAEEQARRGGFASVVLDDPTQSLDDERQVGLADALEELCRSCTVLIAVVPGAFSARLASHVSVKRRFVSLAPWDRTRGARIVKEAVR